MRNRRSCFDSTIYKDTRDYVMLHSAGRLQTPNYFTRIGRNRCQLRTKRRAHPVVAVFWRCVALVTREASGERRKRGRRRGRITTIIARGTFFSLLNFSRHTPLTLSRTWNTFISAVNKIHCIFSYFTRTLRQQVSMSRIINAWILPSTASQKSMYVPMYVYVSRTHTR